MKRIQGAFILVILLLLCHFLLSCSRTSSGEATLEERVKLLESVAPGVGTVMSGVQLHFAKLYFAATAGNWKLAEFEIHEVEENMEASAVLRPEENGVRLGELVEAFEQTQLAAMKDAVEGENLRRFKELYGESVTMCNACHRATGRSFITITIPNAPPVPNQQWAPPVERHDQ